MVKSSGSLVFFSLHNSLYRNEVQTNPSSVQIIRPLLKHLLAFPELQRRGCVAVVFESVEGCPIKPRQGGAAVPVFDVPYGCGIKQWLVRPSTHPDNPGWVQEFSIGGLCIAIARKCVAQPTRINDAVRQIANRFLETSDNGTEAFRHSEVVPSGKDREAHRLPLPHFRRKMPSTR
ncbi:MAG: hypothetical protein WD896_02190 [Parcubacteria group bacterium]